MELEFDVAGDDDEIVVFGAGTGAGGGGGARKGRGKKKAAGKKKAPAKRKAKAKVGSTQDAFEKAKKSK